MLKDNAKYIIFSLIVFVVISGIAIGFILTNEPDTIPIISTGSLNYSSTMPSEIKESASGDIIEDTSENAAEFPLNLNTAEKSELIKLDGIGDVIADRIIDYRIKVNYFYSIDEIKNVKGIGEVIFNKIKDNIYVDVSALPETTIIPEAAESIPVIETSTDTVTVTTKQPEKETSFKIEVDFPIDINSATKDELMCLNGIGEVLSQEIINYRNQNSGFYSIEEMMNVKGIGKSTFNKLKWQIWADTSNLPEKTTTDDQNKDVDDEIETTSKEFLIVNLNTATVSQLAELPEMDEILAENIIYLRDNLIGGSFTSIYEVLYAEDMTNSVFNAIIPYIKVE